MFEKLKQGFSELKDFGSTALKTSAQAVSASYNKIKAGVLNGYIKGVEALSNFEKQKLPEVWNRFQSDPSQKVDVQQDGGSSSAKQVSDGFTDDAPLARQYGMDAATAYQESLANTAHQREVRDLVAAGLNPVLSSSSSGSASFAGSAMMSPAGSGSSAKSLSNKDMLKVGTALSSAILSLSGHPAEAASAKFIGNTIASVIDD